MLIQHRKAFIWAAAALVLTALYASCSLAPASLGSDPFSLPGKQVEMDYTGPVLKTWKSPIYANKPIVVRYVQLLLVMFLFSLLIAVRYLMKKSLSIYILQQQEHCYRSNSPPSRHELA